MKNYEKPMKNDEKLMWEKNAEAGVCESHDHAHTPSNGYTLNPKP